MNKNLIVGLSFLFMFSLALPGLASAMDNPCGQGMEGMHHPGARGMMYTDKEKHGGKHGGKHGKMMQEMHDIVLQTIILLKEEAKSPAAKAKAETLEKRMKAHIAKMKKFRSEMQEMHKMKHGGMKGMNPCNMKKMNPCNPHGGM